ncbi:MAG: hypothetical protein KME50_29585 [Nostoc desertorum CM1-VF14]|jgi:hypothetical protein|nr:hypothetical protein [Nostoc desertorum CM1-VF14]
MNCTLDDYLKVVIPHLRSELVSPEALSHIRSLAKILPPLSLSTLECRLGTEQSRVDFEVNLLPTTLTLPKSFLIHPTWQAFQQIYREWTDSQSFLHQRIKSIWLEFDVDGPPLHVPVPCIFFTLNQTVNQTDELIEMVSRLLNHPISSRFESNLRLSIDSLPSKACIRYIGAMLSRSDQSVRLVIDNIAPKQLPDYLVKIGWTHSINTLQTLISNLENCVDSIGLNCDVGETVLPTIGLECHLECKSPKYEPRWQLFLDYLVDIGLCTPAKRNAILAWSGFCQKASQPEIWPQNLAWGNTFLGTRAFSTFTRNISHIKIVYQPDISIEAKVYLAILHNWVDASSLSRKELQTANSFK